MDNLRSVLGIRRMDKAPNVRARELCGVSKLLDERIDEAVLRWFSHVKRMENDRTVKVYVGECAGNHSVGSLRKRWIDNVKD